MSAGLRVASKQTSTDDAIAKLKALGRAKIVAPGECLFGQADECTGVYWLETGLVGLRKLDEDGTNMLVNLARSGDFLGYGPLLTGDEHVTSAEVLQTSRVIYFDIATMRRLIVEMPVILSMLLRQANHDLTSLEDKYFQMATRQAHARLAAALLSFKSDRTPCDSRESCSFQLPILNKDLADLIGIRPETLSRAIGQLRSAGLAELRGRTVHVPNISKLAQLGGCALQPSYAAMAA